MSWRGILSIEDVIEEINRFASERDWDQFHTPKNLAASISIESGELQELLQWASPSFDEISADPERKKKMEDEFFGVLHNAPLVEPNNHYHSGLTVCAQHLSGLEIVCARQILFSFSCLSGENLDLFPFAFVCVCVCVCRGE